MTADIHTFLSATSYIPPGAAQEIQAHWQHLQGGRKPLGYHQLKYCDTVYGPRRDHPPCLPGTVTPPAETLNRNPKATASRFDVEWET